MPNLNNKITENEPLIIHDEHVAEVDLPSVKFE